MPRQTPDAKRVAAQRDRNLAMMRNPREWPYWPALPVKRLPAGGGWPECGIIVEAGGPFVAGGPTVYMVNIHAPEPITPETARHTYPSFEALVADGWVVD